VRAAAAQTPAGPGLDPAPEPATRDSLIAAREAPSFTPQPFTLRRVANPRYRPPGSGLPGILATDRSQLRALDHFRAQLFHQTPSTPSALTQFELSGGEVYREDDALDVTVGGRSRAGDPELNAVRVTGRHRTLEGSLMDAEPILIGRLLQLTRLRGAVLRSSDPRQGRWIALGGVPTPIPGTATPRLALGGLAVENVRFDDGILSASGFAFWRGGSSGERGSIAPDDTLPGHGATGAFGWSVPLAKGSLGGRVVAQAHALDGARALAAQHALEWTYNSSTFSAWLSDERATRHLRLLGTDRFVPAPRSEDRWNVQGRFADGRAETHLTGVAREGGDPALVSRTVQIGASGSLGRTSWYGGSDAVWDWRALVGREERRVSLYGGGLLTRGHALLTRLEYAARGPEPDALTAMSEASLALPRGARLGLEPRFTWEGGWFHQGDLTARFSWPLAWASSRMTASLTTGSARDDGFRGHVREAAIEVSFTPRPRDRGDLEVRRFDQDGRPLLETRLEYETEVARYGTPGRGWFAGRDTGRVIVRVVRSGNGSGVPDILISLDGKELRFTDAEGAARFDGVTPGVHVVAIEERSLPANHEVVYATRVFVTVEPGRVPDPVSFAIARSERRVRF
jgi:hypothetical protein